MKKLIFFCLCAILASAPLWAAGEYETIRNKTFIDKSYTGVASVKIAQTPLDVRITGSTDGKVTVKCFVEYMEIKPAGYRVEARLDGSTLVIEQITPKTNKGNGLSLRKAVGYIEISVPDRVKNIDVKTVSGDVSLAGVKPGKIAVATVSGDVDADGVKGGDFSVNTVSGDVEVKNCVTAPLWVKTVSGDVQINGCTGEKATAQSISGDISLKDSQYMAVDVNTVSGDLELYPGSDLRDIAVKSVSSDIALHLKGDLKDNDYSMEGVSGQIEIAGVAKAKKYLQINPGKGLVKVRLRTVSGDMTVSND